MVKKARDELMNTAEYKIGRRVRQRRRMLGMSLEQLAEAIGVTYQQIHKYETGVNGVSASKLWKIAEKLEVPIGHFYQDFDQYEINLSQPEEQPEAATSIN